MGQNSQKCQFLSFGRELAAQIAQIVGIWYPEDENREIRVPGYPGDVTPGSINFSIFRQFGTLSEQNCG